MECPNGGMTSGAAHQVSSQGVTVPNLTHPWPTVDMGQDKRGVLSLIDSEGIGANVLFELEQRVPAIEHSCNYLCLAKLGDMTGNLPALI
jgi:hypothetical protein